MNLINFWTAGLGFTAISSVNGSPIYELIGGLNIHPGVDANLVENTTSASANKTDQSLWIPFLPNANNIIPTVSFTPFKDNVPYHNRLPVPNLSGSGVGKAGMRWLWNVTTDEKADPSSTTSNIASSNSKSSMITSAPLPRLYPRDTIITYANETIYIGSTYTVTVDKSETRYLIPGSTAIVDQSQIIVNGQTVSALPTNFPQPQLSTTIPPETSSSESTISSSTTATESSISPTSTTLLTTTRPTKTESSTATTTPIPTASPPIEPPITESTRATYAGADQLYSIIAGILVFNTVAGTTAIIASAIRADKRMKVAKATVNPQATIASFGRVLANGGEMLALGGSSAPATATLVTFLGEFAVLGKTLPAAFGMWGLASAAHIVYHCVTGNKAALLNIPAAIVTNIVSSFVMHGIAKLSSHLHANPEEMFRNYSNIQSQASMAQSTFEWLLSPEVRARFKLDKIVNWDNNAATMVKKALNYMRGDNLILKPSADLAAPNLSEAIARISYWLKRSEPVDNALTVVFENHLAVQGLVFSTVPRTLGVDDNVIVQMGRRHPLDQREWPSFNNWLNNFDAEMHDFILREDPVDNQAVPRFISRDAFAGPFVDAMQALNRMPDPLPTGMTTQQITWLPEHNDNWNQYSAWAGQQHPFWQEAIRLRDPEAPTFQSEEIRNTQQVGNVPTSIDGLSFPLYKSIPIDEWKKPKVHIPPIDASIKRVPGLDSQGKTFNYSHQFIFLLQGDDEACYQAAMNRFNKHPHESTLIYWNPNQQENGYKVMAGPDRKIDSESRIEFVGHGLNEARDKSLPAETLVDQPPHEFAIATKDMLEKYHDGIAPKQISLDACNTAAKMNSTDQHSRSFAGRYTLSFYGPYEKAKRPISTRISGIDMEFSVESDGHKKVGNFSQPVGSHKVRHHIENDNLKTERRLHGCTIKEIDQSDHTVTVLIPGKNAQRKDIGEQKIVVASSQLKLFHLGQRVSLIHTEDKWQILELIQKVSNKTKTSKL